MRVFLIHGAFGAPAENWFPWLKAQLASDGLPVIVPRFPTPAGQTLAAWEEAFSGYEIRPDDIFVAHSLGPAFVLSLLERASCKACFFVAGFTNLLGNEVFDKINKTFVDRQFAWEVIRAHCERFVLFHADDDPYVPLSFGRSFAKNLRGDLHIVKGAGHFNKQAGYVQFPLLLEQIRTLME